VGDSLDDRPVAASSIATSATMTVSPSSRTANSNARWGRRSGDPSAQRGEPVPVRNLISDGGRVALERGVLALWTRRSLPRLSGGRSGARSATLSRPLCAPDR
jgi:hypothetical protein